MIQPSSDRRNHLCAILDGIRSRTRQPMTPPPAVYVLRGNHLEPTYYLPYLRGWWLAFGLSMEALYLASGVELKTIRALEHGQGAARLGTLSRLATALTHSNLQLVTQEPPAPHTLDYCKPEQVQARPDDAGVLCFYLPLLRSTRYLAGFSRHSLAAATGISTDRLSDLEMHHEFATVHEIAALARALNMPPQHLISW